MVCGPCVAGLEEALQNEDARSLVVVTCLQLAFLLEALWKCIHVVAQHFHLAPPTAHVRVPLARVVAG